MPANTDHQSPVLVVEDEALIRMVLVDELEEAGFKVIEAATGEAGLRELERNPDLKALLTDIEMPGKIDGITLAHITNERYPETAVVVVSGRVRPGAGDLPTRAKFFGKPYQYPDLIAALHELMRRVDP